MIEWDDGDGWSRGKNKFGQEGYFPQSYVQATNVSPVSSSPCLPKLSITSSNDGGECVCLCVCVCVYD